MNDELKKTGGGPVMTKEEEDGKEGGVRAGVKHRFEGDWTHTLRIRVLDSDRMHGPLGEVMVVHPGVLGKRSQFFACLDENGGEELELKVPGGMASFRVFVEYLYSGKLPGDDGASLTAQMAVLLFYLAYKYDVPDLMNLCRTWWNRHCFPRPAIKISLHPKRRRPNFDQKADNNNNNNNNNNLVDSSDSSDEEEGGGKNKATEQPYRWRRMNENLLALLTEVYRRSEVLAVFQHVSQVDNSVRLEMGYDHKTDHSAPIICSALLHLALQMWSECHRGPDRDPLLVYGPVRSATDTIRNFERLMETIWSFLPPKHLPDLLSALEQVEVHKTILAAVNDPPGRTLNEWDGVYRMHRLAPMSREARSYVSRCQVGHELGHRMYPLHVLPSLTQSVAAHMLFRIICPERKSTLVPSVVVSPLDDGLTLTGKKSKSEICEHDIWLVLRYLGPRLRIRDALRLMLAALQGIHMKEEKENEKEEDEKERAEAWTFAQNLVRAHGSVGAAAVLGAYVAGNLLLNWERGHADTSEEFVETLQDFGPRVWNPAFCRTLLLAGLFLAAQQPHAFQHISKQLIPQSEEKKEEGQVNGNKNKNNNSNNVTWNSGLRTRYERICGNLLRLYALAIGPAIRSDANCSVQTLKSFFVLCRHIDFKQFRTHDDSWNTLHEIRLVIRKINECEEMKTQLIKEIDRALGMHIHLRLDSLKRWTALSIAPEKGGGLEWEEVLKILMSDERERSLLERERERLRELNDTSDEWFVGKVIDVADVEFWSGRWCPAEVLAKRTEPDGTDLIYIKYIGWPSFYNRWVNTRTELHRLAPLGRHSAERALYGPERSPPSPQNRNQPPVAPPPAPLQVPVGVNNNNNNNNAVIMAGGDPLLPLPLPLPIVMPIPLMPAAGQAAIAHPNPPEEDLHLA